MSTTVAGEWSAGPPPHPPPPAPVETLETITTREFFAAAQSGAMDRVVAMIDQKLVTATTVDAEGITALHWAAINNRHDISEYLLKSGADINAVGGQLVAPPLHWAARQGHLSMMALLVRYNANPHLLDRTNTSILHIGAQFGFPLVVLYAASLGVNVNGLDNDGRTALMWAVFKGFSEDATRILLRFGANVHIVDATGNSALHWAAHQRHGASCDLLIKAGADVELKDAQGSTASEIAGSKGAPMLIENAVEKAVDMRPENTKRRNRAAYAVPFAAISAALLALQHVSWYNGIVVIMMIFYACNVAIDVRRFSYVFMYHFVVLFLCFLFFFHSFPPFLTLFLLSQRVCKQVSITTTPFFTGYFQASFMWVLILYFGHIMWATSDWLLAHLLIAPTMLGTVYVCYLVILGDGGELPVCESDEQIAEQVRNLAAHNKLEARSFCMTCFIRRPLRSKHDRVFNKCYRRFDHYCPWVFNVIAGDNHRAFIAFLITTVITEALFMAVAICCASPTPFFVCADTL